MHPALLDVGEDYNNWDALQDMGFNDEARQLIADAPELLAEVKRLRKTLACIAFSPDDPEWVGEKLDELGVDSDTWKRWHE